ncbi:MAG: DUF1573 domain-containing protein [Bacteroidetes bacterium]|nr:DUF1573 domain-containing protein [Bacteroidota bacterium]
MKIRSLLLAFLLLGSFAGFAQDEKKVLTNIGNDDTNVASFKLTFNSAGKMGVQDKTVTLTSNAKQNPMIIHMKGTVEKPIEQPAVDTKK